MDTVYCTNKNVSVNIKSKYSMSLWILCNFLLCCMVLTVQTIQLHEKNGDTQNFPNDGMDWLPGMVTYGPSGKFEDCKVVNNFFQCYSHDFEIAANTIKSQHTCYLWTIKSLKFEYQPEVCLNAQHAFWYGGAELHYQRWPIQNTTLPMQPFVTNDVVPHKTSFGNVIERYWINSKGVGIIIPPNVPLHVRYSFDKEKEQFLCLKSKDYFNDLCMPTELHFYACKTPNILETHTLMMKGNLIPDVFDKTTGIPDSRMFKLPIWSTWAKYKVEIDQSKVMQYATEIMEHGFSHSQIEIDDMFSSKYGDFDFDTHKFSNASAMINKLKENGFRVTAWITPFANLDSIAFREGLYNGYWLKDIKGKVPTLVKWWQGVGAILDVDNSEAVKWYIHRLECMKHIYNIDSFKFDAGEVTYLPESHEHVRQWTDPTNYTTKYVEAVSKMGSMIEVRCGYRTQKYPVFVRVADKESRWGYDNGLKSLIPTVLTIGILGYPYVLPDMIGGNGYFYSEDVANPFTATQLPSRELYIRWLEVTAYLPAMQFSFVPWQYDDEVVEIALKYVRIHKDVVAPILLEEAKFVKFTGAPLIRPLWWIAPEDTNALECETEFLVGSSLLVAPVLDPGARHRDIYLPEGIWEDQMLEETIHGQKWLKNYPVDINEIATFKRLS